jgi:hypothetical protein
VESDCPAGHSALRKSVVCITATNASPPDSSLTPAQQSVRGGRHTVVSGSIYRRLCDLDQGPTALMFRVQHASPHRFTSISILASARIPAHMEFSVGTGLGADEHLARGLDPRIVFRRARGSHRKRTERPGSGMPASSVLQSSPAWTGCASVRVPVVTISPEVSGGAFGCPARASAK